MTILFDGTNHPTAQQVIDAGCSGALMYGGTPQYAKNFTPSQYRDYKMRGLLTAFAFEIDANDMNGGISAGASHAAALLSNLRAGGVANIEPVCGTVDEHVTMANIPLAVAYQNGFWHYVKNSGWAGPVGGYGFSEFLIAIHDAGTADWYWGAGNRAALPAYTNVWQDNTGTINVGGSADDRDWILVPLPGGTMTLGQPDADGLSTTQWSTTIGKTDPLSAYLKTVGYTPDGNGNITVVAPFGQMTLYNFLRLSQLANATTGALARLDTLGQALAGVASKLDTIAAAEVKTDADVLTAESDVKNSVLSAIAALPAVGPTDAQMADLETKLVAAFPNYNISITKA